MRSALSSDILSCQSPLIAFLRAFGRVEYIKEHHRNRFVDFTLGLTRQFLVGQILFNRAMQQLTRDAQGLMIDLALYTGAGALLGAVFKGSEFIGPLSEEVQELCPPDLALICSYPQSNDLPVQGSFTILALGLLGLASSSRCFGREKVVWFRESEAGLPTLPYFLAKCCSQVLMILIAPGAFLTMYYAILQPRSTYREIYEIYVIATYVAFGFGYTISIILHEKQAVLASIVTQLVFTMLGGVTPTLKQLKANEFTSILSDANWCRWLQEWYVLTEIRYYGELYNLTTAYDFYSYEIDNEFSDRMYALIIGTIMHCLAVSIIFYRAGARGDQFKNRLLGSCKERLRIGRRRQRRKTNTRLSSLVKDESFLQVDTP